MEMLILELISIITLTFTLLTVLFEIDQLRGIVLFLYVVLIFSFFLWKKLEGKYAAGLMVILFSLPWLMEMTRDYAFFTALYTTVFTLYYYRKLGKLYPEDLSFRFRVTYGVLFVITLIGTMNSFMGRLVGRALPYMLLYFFSTIILTTSLRHRQAGLDEKKTRRNIMLYLAITTVLSLVATIEELRNGALHLLKFLYGAILEILYYVIYPIAYAGFWVFTKIIALVKRIPPREEAVEEQALESFTDAFQESVQEIRSTPLLDTLIPLILVLVMIFLIVRFMKGRKGQRAEELPFEEVREFILDEREKGRRKRRERLPETAKEQIRYYYRRYLRNIGKHVKIEKSDTTFTVKEKGSAYFRENEEIRSLYASLRYTEKEADGEMVKTFRTYVEEGEK
ncbi:hypothetical protein ACHAL6_02660 [Proteiniclasticum sp. C24MP]|uniref:hypothetical protein n=1 Tax=Proteiniclasticum sp. C24MP TaxID=3374101 RepID=UPI0037542B39